MSIYTEYNDVKDKVNTFRNSLNNLYTSLTTLYNDQLPVLYIATADKKQFWFIQCETVTLNNDADGHYSISISGCGVRAYFASEVDMSAGANSFPTVLAQKADPSSSLYDSAWPNMSSDFAHCGMGNLTRYEVFGQLNVNYSPQRMSISDMIRNNTIGNTDDFLIGHIKNPHFVGNFAKTASHILDMAQLGPNY